MNAKKRFGIAEDYNKEDSYQVDICSNFVLQIPHNHPGTPAFSCDFCHDHLFLLCIELANMQLTATEQFCITFLFIARMLPAGIDKEITEI